MEYYFVYIFYQTQKAFSLFLFVISISYPSVQPYSSKRLISFLISLPWTIDQSV